jgi:hypothetical protein
VRRSLVVVDFNEVVAKNRTGMINVGSQIVEQLIPLARFAPGAGGCLLQTAQRLRGIERSEQHE